VISVPGVSIPSLRSVDTEAEKFLAQMEWTMKETMRTAAEKMAHARTVNEGSACNERDEEEE
jgi:hypothetical protein